MVIIIAAITTPPTPTHPCMVIIIAAITTPPTPTITTTTTTTYDDDDAAAATTATTTTTTTTTTLTPSRSMPANPSANITHLPPPINATATSNFIIYPTPLP
jgi:hypothetical protein